MILLRKVHFQKKVHFYVILKSLGVNFKVHEKSNSFRCTALAYCRFNIILVSYEWYWEPLARKKFKFKKILMKEKYIHESEIDVCLSGSNWERAGSVSKGYTYTRERSRTWT